MFCPLPGRHGTLLLFCQGKKFSTKNVYTFRKRSVVFPQVENSVEKVQNSSVQACFPGGIPHFPQGFPQSYLDRLRTLHTFCNFQVRIMTKFWSRAALVLPFYPTSFWRMLKCVENPRHRCTRQMLQHLWNFVARRRTFLPLLHQPLCAVPVPQQLYARKSACSDWF